MKQVLRFIFTLILSAPWTVPAQSFEGTLTYVLDVFVPKNNVFGTTREKLLEEKKSDNAWYDTVKVSYQGGNYQLITNSASHIRNIYNAESNTLYSFYDYLNDEICSVRKAIQNPVEKPIIQRPDSIFTINQFKCKLVRMRWQKSWIEYYYSPGVCKVKPELFAQHGYEGLNEFLKITGVLPIRIVTGYRGLKYPKTLVNIHAGQVDPAIFKIPELVEAPDYSMMQVNGVQIYRVKK